MPDKPLILTEIETKETKEFCTSVIGALSEMKQNHERAIDAFKNGITWLEIDMKKIDKWIDKISDFRARLRGE